MKSAGFALQIVKESGGVDRCDRNRAWRRAGHRANPANSAAGVENDFAEQYPSSASCLQTCRVKTWEKVFERSVGYYDNTSWREASFCFRSGRPVREEARVVVVFVPGGQPLLAFCIRCQRCCGLHNLLARSLSISLAFEHHENLEHALTRVSFPVASAFRTGIAVLDPQQRSTLGDLIVAGDERLQEALDSFESRLAIEPLRCCCCVCVCVL